MFLVFVLPLAPGSWVLFLNHKASADAWMVTRKPSVVRLQSYTSRSPTPNTSRFGVQLGGYKGESVAKPEARARPRTYTGHQAIYVHSETNGATSHEQQDQRGRKVALARWRCCQYSLYIIAPTTASEDDVDRFHCQHTCPPGP